MAAAASLSALAEGVAPPKRSTNRALADFFDAARGKAELAMLHALKDVFAVPPGLRPRGPSGPVGFGLTTEESPASEETGNDECVIIGQSCTACGRRWAVNDYQSDAPKADIAAPAMLPPGVPAQDANRGLIPPIGQRGAAREAQGR